MNNPTYHELVKFYGRQTAYGLLLSIKRWAKVRRNIVCLNNSYSSPTFRSAMGEVMTHATYGECLHREPVTA